MQISTKLYVFYWKIFPLLIFFFLLFSFQYAQAQTGTISGQVNDEAGEALVGATVLIKGTGQGVITDVSGNFSLPNIAYGSYTLEISFIGYSTTTQEVNLNNSNVNIAATLAEDVLGMDAVVVTGVFDERTKMESSVAITTISAESIQKLAPLSATDLLKDVPGIFVNSELGEIRNVVYSRGLSAGSEDAAAGYFYVSLQEDGLPVTAFTDTNYGPDYYYRLDNTMGRLEAVRGGSAAIVTSNGPGGVFNYISKTGGREFAGDVRVKYGLQGDNQSYIRTDLNVGGPMGNRWFYNVGGFYRYDEGARNTGDYPLNQGGQIKANVLKENSKGYFKFYAKYLNDRNGWYEPVPAVNFRDPEVASGFTNRDAITPSDVDANYFFAPDGNVRSFNPSNLIHSQDFALGFDFVQEFGEGWSIRNNIKYSYKDTDWQSDASVYTAPLNDISAIFLSGAATANVAPPPITGLNPLPLLIGGYNFRYADTGELAATMAFDLNTGTIPIISNNMASDLVIPQLGLERQVEVNEIMDQITLSKKIDNMTFNLGGFFAYSDYSFFQVSPGLFWTTYEPRPRILTLDIDHAYGSNFQITDANGLARQGQLFPSSVNAEQTILAGYFNHNWEITEGLNLDWGVRYENINVQGTTRRRDGAASTDIGGLDNNSLTFYDNVVFEDDTYNFDETLDIFSYSIGLNYLLSDGAAIFGRFTRGNRIPDLVLYSGIDSEFEEQNLDPRPQKITQAELGFKYNQGGLSLFVTPFYSLVEDIPDIQTLTDENNVFYSSVPLFNSIETIGVELEGNYTPFDGFNIHLTTTLQQAKLRDFRQTLPNSPIRADDEIVDFSNNDAPNTPNLMINLTPSYTVGRLNAFVSWQYMGERAANNPNAFTLPDYSVFNLGVNYNVLDNLNIQLNVNNVLESEGVISWFPPGLVFDRNLLTEDAVNAAGSDASLGIVPVIPRSFFLTVNYSF